MKKPAHSSAFAPMFLALVCAVLIGVGDVEARSTVATKSSTTKELVDRLEESIRTRREQLQLLRESIGEQIETEQ